MVFRFNPLDWGVFAVSIPIIYLRYTYTIMLFFYTLCFIILKYKENKNRYTPHKVYRNPKSEILLFLFFDEIPRNIFYYL
jgi:hypothetical protein